MCTISRTFVISFNYEEKMLNLVIKTSLQLITLQIRQPVLTY